MLGYAALNAKNNFMPVLVLARKIFLGLTEKTGFHELTPNIEQTVSLFYCVHQNDSYERKKLSLDVVFRIFKNYLISMLQKF